MPISEQAQIKPGHAALLLYVSEKDVLAADTFLRRVAIMGLPQLNVMQTSLGIEEEASIQWVPEGEVPSSEDEAMASRVTISKSGVQIGSRCKLTENGLELLSKDGSSRLFLGADEEGSDFSLEFQRGESLRGVLKEDRFLILSPDHNRGMMLDASNLIFGTDNGLAPGANPWVKLSAEEIEEGNGRGYLQLRDVVAGKDCSQTLTPSDYALVTSGGRATIGVESVSNPCDDRLPPISELRFRLSDPKDTRYFLVALSGGLLSPDRVLDIESRTDRLEFVDAVEDLMFGIGLNSSYLYTSCPEDGEVPYHIGQGGAGTSDKDAMTLNENVDFASSDVPFILFKSCHPHTCVLDPPKGRRNNMTLISSKLAINKEGWVHDTHHHNWLSGSDG